MGKTLDAFQQFRPLLFSIAYRMLGSTMEAEDILQEAYLRYRDVDKSSIESPKHYLSTIVTRLSLNHLDRAREKRETYIGPWLPEPLLTEDRDIWLSPSERVEEIESISMAFLVLLERLTPEERAVFLLREVFQYPYAQVATILEKSEESCRQMLHRAKVHIAANRPRFVPANKEHRQMLKAFIDAIRKGNLQELTSMLAEDASLVADAGGRVRGAALHPIHGADAVAKFLMNSTRFAPRVLQPEFQEVNGQAAIVLRSGEQTFLVAVCDVVGEKIQAVRLIANPDKLGGLSERLN
jgi:RNA polymerase sigma-70 factor, ECF subfamily